tara:strand:+ start:8029 stop:8646 length:618 start_codon:yes stop_codon:yes gene_type:complete
MVYPATASIADRMRVLDFKASLLKQDPNAAAGGATAAMPSPVTPPANSTMPDMGGPTPEDLAALSAPMQEVPVYGDNTEAFLDFKQKMTDLSMAVTSHMNTASVPIYTEGQDTDTVNMFIEGLKAFRNHLEDGATILTKIGMLNPSVLGDMPGPDMPMGGPPGMGGGPPGMGGMPMPPGLMNMPGPGPAGMPPGGMANAGPMGGM